MTVNNSPLWKNRPEPKMPRPVVRKPGEGGFALLIVFVMAAAISISLYLELPRSVFESQRAKEELLFDRGDQYKMGIKRYYMKFQRYPNTIEEMEQTNGTRYLRRRYKDPFTGKDDWKILKFGPGGEIEGSVHNKKKTGLEKEKDPKSSQGSVVAGPSLGDLNQGDNGGNRLGPNGEDRNPALNRRPSDTGIGAQLANAGAGAGAAAQLAGAAAGVYGAATLPQFQPGYQAAQPPGQFPALPGAAPNPFGGQSGNPSFTGGQPFPQQQGFPQQAQYQQPNQGGPNRLPGGASPYPGMPGQAANSQNGGQIGVPFGGPGGQPGGIGQPNGQNPALQMINQLLTSPRQGVQVGQLTGGNLAGAMPTGIAGVVSKHKGQGIKVLEERTKIHEWEFIYDVRKDKSLQKGAMGPQQSGTLPGSGLNNSSGIGPNSNGLQNRRQ